MCGAERGRGEGWLIVYVEKGGRKGDVCENRALLSGRFVININAAEGVNLLEMIRLITNLQGRNSHCCSSNNDSCRCLAIKSLLFIFNIKHIYSISLVIYYMNIQQMLTLTFLRKTIKKEQEAVIPQIL